MDVQTAVLLFGVAFMAGAINSVAGGGTLISFPGLLAAGFGPKMANVTNTVAVVPGFLGGSIAYRDEVRRQPANVKLVVPPALLGSLTGSIILLSTPESTFEAVVPFLIYGACFVLAYQDRISAFYRRGVTRDDAHVETWRLRIAIFCVTIYGGYFGAAMGIIVLAALGVFLPDDIQRSNALKGIVALVTNALAAAYFAVFANVAWDAAGVMAFATLVGGFVGARVAMRLSKDRLRLGIISYGVVAATVLLIRLFV
jgi:uncharacterized membrane protein YfcA